MGTKIAEPLLKRGFAYVFRDGGWAQCWIEEPGDRHVHMWSEWIDGQNRPVFIDFVLKKKYAQ